MRKVLILSSILIVLSLTVGITSANTNGQNTTEDPIGATMPPNISKIIQNSCIDCHAKGGKKSAMSHVNFSDWDNYPPEKKQQKQLI
jgi:hypothetical protein